MLSRLTLICAVLGGTVVRADDSFTKALTPADFQAAGLGKLTPDELAKLDELVRAQQSGAVAKAKEETAKVVTETVTAAVKEETTKAVTAAVREETTKAVAQEVRQQVQAEDRTAAQKQASSAGFIDRVKVVLKPGTEIEYTTLDATLVGAFHGWQNGTILTLANGQRWVVVDDDRYWAPSSGKPVHVRIVPGILGSFFMEIEKGGRPRVRFLGNAAAPQAPQ
jgi:hypothetical protein